MRSKWMISVAAVAAMVSAAGTEAKPRPMTVADALAGMTIAQAVADPTRSSENLARDASRKPAELLSFLGLKQGMQVADMFGANHYWAEIFVPAVGPKGSVTIWNPAQFYDDKDKAELEAFAASRPNVSILTSPFAEPNLPAARFDFMLINLDYHDVYWKSAKYGIDAMDPAAWLKTVFTAMKPGGTVGVVDHVGPAGDTRAIVEKMHRIDPATVRADFEKAGFVLDGESQLLRNPADDHSLGVFDAAIKGKTDRFIYRFKKPR